MMKTIHRSPALRARCLPAVALTSLLLAAGSAAQAQTVTKANNTEPLNSGASWVNGLQPFSGDIALWDSTVTGPNTVTLGDSFQGWGQLRLTNPGGLVTINDPANMLTLYALGGVGIDLAAATQNLTLNCGLTVAAAQTWNVSGGRTLISAAANTFNAVETKKEGGGTLVFSGASPGTGNNVLTLLGGTTLLSGGNDRLPQNTHVQLGNATLDVGGNLQTLARLRFANSFSATTSIAVVTNGSVVINDAVLATGNDNDFATGANSVFDASGLNTLVFDAPNRVFRVLPWGQAANNITNTLLLARTGPAGGSNYLRASTFQVGGASGSSANNNHRGIARLGTANVLNVNVVQIGGFNGRGLVAFQPGLNAPSLVIRDRTAAGPAATLKIGETSSGSRSGEATLDLTGGSLDAWVNEVQLGRMIAGANVNDTSTLILPAGTLTATNFTLAFKNGNATVDAPTITSTMNQLGGAVTVVALVMGTNANSATSTPVLRPTYNLSGGILRAANIVAGEGRNSGATTVRALNWTNGVIRNYDAATDLAINNTTASNGISINALGLGTRAFEVDAARAAVVAVRVNQGATGATPVAKTGAGTLDLTGDVDNPFAAVDVQAGTVLLNKISGASVHALGADSILNAGLLQLAGSGGDQIADVRSLTLNGGTFDLNGLAETIAGVGGPAGTVTDALGGGTLTLNAPSGSNYTAGATLAGSFNLTKSGQGKQTLHGADSRSSGVNTVNGGILEIGNGGATGSLTGDTTVDTGGTLAFNRSGTLNFTGTISGAGNVAQNGSGTLVLAGADLHTGATLVNAGTLAVPIGASALGGSIITVADGATLDLSAGSSFALFTQTLNGAGNVRGPLFVGSGSTVAGTLKLSGNVQSGDASILSPGGMLAAGTLTITNHLLIGEGTVLKYDLASVTTTGAGVNDLIQVGGTLDLSQPCTLEIRQLGGVLASGTYVLATYGAFAGNPANVTLVGSPRFGYTLTAVSGQLRLAVTGSPASLVWRGDGAANLWDDGITTDWFNSGSSALDKFYNGDAALFDNSGSNNVPVSIAGQVYPSSFIVNASKDYTLTGPGAVAGNTGLSKSGAGTLEVQSLNEFTGPVRIHQGVVSVGEVAPNGAPSPLGAGTTLELNGGALRYTGANVTADAFNRALLLGPAGGTIALSAAGNFMFLTNTLAGDGALTKAGDKQLILGQTAGGVPIAGANTYTGATYVVEGQLQVRHPQALGATVGKTIVTAPGNLAVGGGWTGELAEPLDLSGDGGGGGALQVNDAGTSTTFTGPINLLTDAAIGGASPSFFAAPIAGAGSLTKAGGGTVTLLSSANTYSGGVVIHSGTLRLGTNGTTGWLAPQPTGKPITNHATLSFNRSDTATLNDAITGAGTLVQAGDGVTVLTAPSDFTGAAFANNGALRVQNQQALGAPAPGTTVAGGANLTARVEFAGGVNVPENFTLGQKAGTNNLNGAQAPHLVNHAGANTLTGNVQLTGGGNYWGLESAAGTLTLTTLTNDAGGFTRPIYLQGVGAGVINGTLEDLTDQWLQIRKHGDGVWTLDGDIKLPQGFGAFEGRLVIAPTCNYLTGSAAQQGFFSVREAGTLVMNDPDFPAAGEVDGNGRLIGNGVINNLVTAKGGTVSPGDPIGALTLSSGLTMQAAATLLLELDRSQSPSNDVLVTFGLVPAGTLSVVNLGPQLQVGDKFTLLSWPVFGDFAVTNLPAGYTWQNDLGIDGSITVTGITLPTTPTNVSISLDGDQLTIAWPASHTGWILQTQTNPLTVGLSNNWADVPGSATVNSVTVTVDPANPTRFFRLRFP